MKLAVIGTGYVGLVAGVCFAEAGNDVICVDVDESKLSRLRAGELTIYEPGLEHLFRRNLQEERLTFSSDLADATQRSQILFLALPTPPGADGAADLSYVLGAAENIGALLTAESEYKIIVTKSTVPVGTADKVRAALSRHAHGEFDVVSNPEFLREGVAVDDFMRPERVVIGTESPRAERLMRELYHPFLLSGNPLLVMDNRSAEVTKYAANAMLALRISFMNDIANLCQKCGADVDKVRLGVGLDSRIGKRFLFSGIGYGGSCFAGDETVFADAGNGLRAWKFADLWHFQQAVAHDKNVSYKCWPELRVLAYDLEKNQSLLAPVQALTQRIADCPLLLIKTSMGRTMRLTADHPVVLYEEGEWRVRLAGSVQPGDQVAALCGLPRTPTVGTLDLLSLLRNTPLENAVHVTSRSGAFTEKYHQFKDEVPASILRHPHEIKQHNRMPLRLYFYLRELGVLQVDEADLQLYTAKGAATKINARISLDSEFFRLCGYFLAEGFISCDIGRAGACRERIGFSFYENEREYIFDVQRILESLGLKYITQHKSGALSTLVSSRVFAWLLRDVLLLGTRSENKALPAFVWGAPMESKLELIRGAFSGDGSVTPLQKGRNVMLEYATVSPALANGLLLLLQSIGVVASQRTRRLNKSKQDAFILRVNGHSQVQALCDCFGETRRPAITEILEGYQRQIRQRGFVRYSNFSTLEITDIKWQERGDEVYSMETATGTLVISSGLISHNCFPKDVQALIATGQMHGAPQRLLEATEAINQEQKRVLIPRIVEHFGGDISGRKFALWGLSFKPNTDDMREAPSLTLIEELLARGAQVSAYDPEAVEVARRIIGEKITYAKRHYEACDGADALIIATEWNKFREPDFGYLKELLKQPVIFDGRNIYELETMLSRGFTYYSIGRPDVR